MINEEEFTERFVPKLRTMGYYPNPCKISQLGWAGEGILAYPSPLLLKYSCACRLAIPLGRFRESYDVLDPAMLPDASTFLKAQFNEYVNSLPSMRGFAHTTTRPAGELRALAR